MVRISKPAAAEWDSAVAFLRRESSRAADAVHFAIERTVDSLANLPNRGRPGQIPGTRELIVRGAPYVVAYTVAGEVVTVLRIRHTSQDPSPD
jgi:toxin ParE1/3/4